jgi:hypothetical protein
LLLMAVFCFAAVLNAKKTEGIEQKLKWARETIDSFAVTHHFEAPAKSSGSKWQVTRIEGCTVELKESAHRESPDSVVTDQGIFGLSEDRTVMWSFNLANLIPRFIAASDVGGPHIEIVSEGDAFHFNTEVESRTVGKDGTTVNATNWSAPGTARNFRIYFDSPAADNNSLVRRLEHDLRDAADRCAVEARSADHQRWK